MRHLLFLCGVLTLTACQYGTIPINIHHDILSQPISLHNTELKNCTFNPQARIVHFPMYHYPENGQYDQAIFDLVAKSQFQLLQTIVAYKNNISVFDENITHDKVDSHLVSNLRRGYSQGSYTRLDGTTLQYLERYRTAYSLFGNGIPRYYENLSQNQKDYLFQTGASWTLLYLGLIPKIHKVITPGDFGAVKTNLTDSLTGQFNSNISNADYWIFNFREQKLKEEVLKLYNGGTAQRLILIAYGADHDFSDEFYAYPFQSGNFCLRWIDPSFQQVPS